MAKESRLSAWWAYNLARVYAPDDEAIDEKMKALGVKATIDLSSANIERQVNLIGKMVSDVMKDWPKRTTQTDVSDLRLLLNSKIADDFRCSEFALPGGKAKLLLSSPSVTMDEIIKALGKPEQDMKQSKYDVRFITYGRVRLVGNLKGEVFAVLFNDGE